MLFLRPTWHAATAAAKSLQLCPTLCDPIDGSPPGSPVPGILQTRTLEWVAIAFSNAWKWKVKVKSLSRVPLLATPWTAAHQAPSMGFPGKSTGVGAIAFSKPDTTGKLVKEWNSCQAWTCSVASFSAELDSVAAQGCACIPGLPEDHFVSDSCYCRILTSFWFLRGRLNCLTCFCLI